MHSVRLLHGNEILWACIWRYLTTSERLHIYRKTNAFLERWRMFLLHRNAKTVTAHNLADNNNSFISIYSDFFPENRHLWGLCGLSECRNFAV